MSGAWRLWLTCVLIGSVTAACGQVPETGLPVSGVAMAGPVCPVETNPPDPACVPRPVVEAVVQAVDDAGEVFESLTGPDGRFAFVLRPGRYEIVPQPVEGIMGTPAPFEVEVVLEALDLGVLMYDTGIR